jgi:hypothetical protein
MLSLRFSDLPLFGVARVVALGVGDSAQDPNDPTHRREDRHLKTTQKETGQELRVVLQRVLMGSGILQGISITFIHFQQKKTGFFGLNQLFWFKPGFFGLNQVFFMV